MTTVNVIHDVDLDVIQCYLCGVIFGMNSDMNKKRIQDHREWYCPNGHPQVYTGKTEAQKLKEQLAEEQRKLANAQFELMMKEKEAKKLRKRVSNGICPCCHRSFIQMSRHMKTKHPDYVGENNDVSSKAKA